ncbi:MAG: hypothetical protein MPW14_06445 [Candidatus Manganitrophus sp.]|nr:MAG: hypothetical protein MPW14_06445 [Candidatus Manganitrophus sp.]
MKDQKIIIKGAREHNLKNVDVELPRDSLVVITGLSGSGKSSLAFDTIYAEGQRRYVETLSAYARQFLELMQKPDVDHIDGLSPAISIEQKTTSRNPRSTVGTVTEIYDYLRLLFARIGVPYSPATGLPIESQTVSQMVDRILCAARRHAALHPCAHRPGPEGRIQKGAAGASQKGLPARQGGRKVLRDRRNARTQQEAETRHRRGGGPHRRARRSGQPLAGFDGNGAETLRGRHRRRRIRRREGRQKAKRSESSFPRNSPAPFRVSRFPEIEPRLFSFNSPHGACPKCDGLGTQLFFDAELVVPDTSLSLREGAIAPWSRTQIALALLSANTGRPDPPLQGVDDRALEIAAGSTRRSAILYGTGRRGHRLRLRRRPAPRTETKKPFEGVIPNLERRWKETDSPWVREELERYQDNAPCDACGGHRLRPEALAVKIAARHHRRSDEPFHQEPPTPGSPTSTRS